VTVAGIAITIYLSPEDLPEDSDFSTRLPRSNGRWLGEPGNSGWQSDLQEVNDVTGGKPIPFRNGFPDFSEWSWDEVEISDMTGEDTRDFAQADEEYARKRGWLKKNGEPNKAESYRYRKDNRLSWHHVEDGVTMMLVPEKLHGNIPHTGGAATVKGSRGYGS